jgi:hypothetical protein
MCVGERDEETVIDVRWRTGTVSQTGEIGEVFMSYNYKITSKRMTRN